MNLSSDFAKILREVFSLDYKWVDWFVRDVYKEEELKVSYVENRPASVMLSTPYLFKFLGNEVRCDYISCVATLPAHRGKGLMRQLMHSTLTESWTEKVPFVALIPASRPLYFIYDKMGFATVFYVDEERYTSLHEFEKGEGFEPVKPEYEIFNSLESKRETTILHTEAQFNQAVKDINLSNGYVVSIKGPDDSCAIAFAEDGNEIKVVELLSTDEKASEAVLSEIRNIVGEKSIIVSAFPKEESISLRARGMIRIVNVKKVLELLASSLPSLKMTFKINDDFLPENNGVYMVKSGKCEMLNNFSGNIDLDVSIDVLSKILFSDKKIGDLFNLPTSRPIISLMLD